MSVYSNQYTKRTKEIGIPKVLGSSVSGITGLFLKAFFSVVWIAGLIACPLAWLLMQNWLDDYAYHIHITLIPFILSIALLTVITIALIVLQTFKAALANPINSLRNERA